MLVNVLVTTGPGFAIYRICIEIEHSRAVNRHIAIANDETFTGTSLFVELWRMPRFTILRGDRSSRLIPFYLAVRQDKGFVKWFLICNVISDTPVCVDSVIQDFNQTPSALLPFSAVMPLLLSS